MTAAFVQRVIAKGLVRPRLFVDPGQPDRQVPVTDKRQRRRLARLA